MCIYISYFVYLIYFVTQGNTYTRRFVLIKNKMRKNEEEKRQHHCAKYKEYSTKAKNVDNSFDGNPFVAGDLYREAAKHAYHTSNSCPENKKQKDDQTSKSKK